MKFKNILLTMVVLTVLFIGCARRQAPIQPGVGTGTGSEAKSGMVDDGGGNLTGTGTGNTIGNDTRILPGSGGVSGTGNPTANGTRYGNDTGNGPGTGKGTGYGTGTANGSGARNGDGTGTAVGEGTGPRMGSGTNAGAGTGAASGGSIQNGTFNSDLYISANNFRLINTTVNGNIYFTTNEAKSTFTMDAKSKVTGTQQLMR